MLPAWLEVSATKARQAANNMGIRVFIAVVSYPNLVGSGLLR
jgi:hypothetical protein